MSIGILVCALLLIGFAYSSTRSKPSTLTGWWHYQHPGRPATMWQPDAWKTACDSSLEKSRRRRYIDG